MGLTMRERHAVTRELTERYQKASKKARGAILTDFCALTGYSRYHARFLLRNCGKRFTKMVGRARVTFICAQARPQGAARTRAKRYGSGKFLEALKRLWALSDGLCGKRLKAFLTSHAPTPGGLRHVAGDRPSGRAGGDPAAALGRQCRNLGPPLGSPPGRRHA